MHVANCSKDSSISPIIRFRLVSEIKSIDEESLEINKIYLEKKSGMLFFKFRDYQSKIQSGSISPAELKTTDTDDFVLSSLPTKITIKDIDAMKDSITSAIKRKVALKSKSLTIQDPDLISKLKCLKHRKYHQLYSKDPAAAPILELPIVRINKDLDLEHDFATEEVKLEDHFKYVLYITKTSASELRKTLSQFISNFFYTGEEDTERYKFSTNEAVEDYVFNTLKHTLTDSSGNIEFTPADKKIIVEEIAKAKSKVEKSKHEENLKTICRRNFQDIFSTLEVIAGSSYSFLQEKIFQELKVDVIKGPTRVIDRNCLEFKVQGTNTIYRLLFPAVGHESGWKEMMLKRYKDEYKKPELTVDDISLMCRPIIHVSDSVDPKSFKKLSGIEEVTTVTTAIKNSIKERLSILLADAKLSPKQLMQIRAVVDNINDALSMHYSTKETKGKKTATGILSDDLVKDIIEERRELISGGVIAAPDEQEHISAGPKLDDTAAARS